MIQKTSASIDDILHTIIFDFIVKIVMQKVVLQFAFLGWPIINPLFSLVLSWFAGELFDQLSMFFKFQAIDSEVAEQVEGYKEAIEELKAALALPEDDVERESVIDHAKEEYKKKLADLIRFPMPGPA